MTVKRYFPGLLMLLMLLQGASQVASAQPAQKVFQIGTFDRSSFGFASGEPAQAVKYVIGESTPKKDWYAVQPAVLQAEAAGKVTPVALAPRSIVFDLPGAVAASYRLHVALLIETPSVPTLVVGINGKQGTFYLHPKLDYENGDQGDSFYPAYSHADAEISFPGKFLQKGQNTITLQAVEDADQQVPEASLTYDAIELVAAGKSASGTSTAILEPTVFYQQKNSSLVEEVDAFIRYNARVQPGTPVELSIAGKHYTEHLQGHQDFGEERVKFLVAEFPAQSHAQLAWQVAGHREQVSSTIDPQKKWTLLLVPHNHLDVGYSDYPAKVAAVQRHVLDEALDLTDEHPDFRFSTDGEWNLEQFLKTRSAAQQQRAITAMQQEKFFVPADYANVLTGFPTAEALIRSLYPSANFSRIHHTPFNYATITDVPSYTWSYASILASAGIHYLAGGSNNYRAPVLLQGKLNEDSPFWWEGPDGGKVLLWYSRIYQQMQMLFGLPPIIPAGRDTIPLFLQQYEHPGYHASSVLLYGTQVENTDLFPQQAELAAQWNKQYAFPHMEYSGFHAALVSIQKQFGNDIPTIRGDGGPYWEDGIASGSRYAALERQTEAKAPTAEKLATLTAIINPQTKADTADLDNMWKDIVLMDEHTWDSYDSVNDPTSMESKEGARFKDAFSYKAAALSDFVTKSSLATIVQNIPVSPGHVIVFNALNWKRDGMVSIDLPKGDEIVDVSSGATVPTHLLFKGQNFSHVRFLASDVPAVGYKVYLFQKQASGQAPAETSIPNTNVIESPYYRVTLDPETGAVRSIYDKQLQRELVNQKSPYRFGEYLYVSGGDKAPNTLLQYSHVYPKPDLEVHQPQGGTLVSITRTPYGEIARMTSHDTETPSITAEIRLFNKQKKIEFVETVNKKKVDTKEAVYFAFPFAMDQPEFQYEIQNGVVNPAKDMYPGAGHEWFSVQHWVAVQQNGFSGTVMPLDAALVTLGDINRGQWPTEFGNRPGTIFSYPMNNYWDTNYRAGQGGSFKFRYIVTSAPSTDPAALSRMGWAEATPLTPDIVTSQDKGIAPSLVDGKMQYPSSEDIAKTLNIHPALSTTEQSFLKVQDPDVVLDTWKTAEDGKGTILRFIDLGGAARTISVETPPLHLTQAWLADSVERDQKQLPLNGTNGFSFPIRPHQIVTVRLIGTPSL